MPTRFYKNAPAHTIPSGVANNSTTSIVVDSVAGWPTQFPFRCIIEPDETLEEIVLVTAIVGTTLTVVRGDDGSTAAAHAAGVKIVHGYTAGDATEANEHINDTTDVHGATGSLVGTGGTQTISGQKNFTGGLQRGGSEVLDVGSAQSISGVKNFVNLPTTSSAGAFVMTGGGEQFITDKKNFLAMDVDGAEDHTGTETHSGAETHTGTETHSGTVRFSHANMQPTSVSSSTDETGITGQTFAPGSSPVGLTFVAPPSGKVYLTAGGYIIQDITTEVSFLSATVRTGGTIGSGTVVSQADSDNGIAAGSAVDSGGPARAQTDRRRLITGLTAGSTYNAQVEMATTVGGNMSVFHRSLIVEPVF